MYQKELEEIGKRIEELRKSKGWTQEMLAEKLNISRNTLSKLEGGFRDFKSTEILAIAKVLEVSTDYLLGLTDMKRSDIEAREVSERYGLCEAALTELSSLPELGVPASLEHLNAMDRQAETMSYRTVINLLLTNLRGKKALRLLASYYSGTIEGKNLTSITLPWRLPDCGGIWIDNTMIPDELILNGALELAKNELAQIKIDKESADNVNERIKVWEQQKGKPLTEKEVQRAWELYALEKSPVPYHPYERDIIYKEGSDNG
jgi:transcriptional regulator with XRE-family HTH domain